MQISKEAKWQEVDLETARAFADKNPDIFDDGFLSSLEEFYRKNCYLTAAQHEALQNLIERWDMI